MLQSTILPAARPNPVTTPRRHHPVRPVAVRLRANTPLVARRRFTRQSVSRIPWHVVRPALIASGLIAAFFYVIVLPVADALLPILHRLGSAGAT